MNKDKKKVIGAEGNGIKIFILKNKDGDLCICFGKNEKNKNDTYTVQVLKITEKQINNLIERDV